MKGTEITPHELRQAEQMVRAAVQCAGGVDSKQTVVISMSPRIAWLFADHLQQYDPDMPAPAMCKILGPLVGDMMMNAKLQRLDTFLLRFDDLADRIGPTAMQLLMALDQAERLAKTLGKTGET